MTTVISRLRKLLVGSWRKQRGGQNGDREIVALDGDELPVHQIDTHEGRVILSVDVATAVEQGYDFSSVWRHKQVDVSMDDRDFSANIDMCSVEHGFAAIGLEPMEEQ